MVEVVLQHLPTVMAPDQYQDQPSSAAAAAPATAAAAAGPSAAAAAAAAAEAPSAEERWSRLCRGELRDGMVTLLGHALQYCVLLKAGWEGKHAFIGVWNSPMGGPAAAVEESVKVSAHR